MTKLFEIQLRVHPAAGHPQFEKFNFGLLLIWLYSTDEKAAYAAAMSFFNHLPYKLISGKSFDAENPEDQANLTPFELDGAVKAAQTGFYIDLIAYPLDANENQVLGNWPLILPQLPS